MQDESPPANGDRTPRSQDPGSSADEPPRILVCIDLARETSAIIPPARAIARALDGKLEFLHVLETHGPTETGSPVDPVEWDIIRREAKAHMAHIAEGDETLVAHLLEGRSAEQICSEMASRPQDIAVLGRGDEVSRSYMGETVRKMLESGLNSLLLVPIGVEPKQKFSRILVPLDCSGRSERIMPVVEKIARSENAELILVHAVPEPVLSGGEPGQSSDQALKSQINQRNERFARDYLDRLCGRVRADGLRVRSLVLCGGDVRRQLAAAIGEQATDLLVLASHGHSGFADVPFGDVASYLVKQADVPTMLIRLGDNVTQGHAYSDARSKGVRSPGTLAQ